ncbi:hypothetical protein GCM10010335_46090 [Streptomyces galbus]|nr:hypothetical protein GCM10010335_46090 [Streptomyces galbus]
MPRDCQGFEQQARNTPDAHGWFRGTVPEIHSGGVHGTRRRAPGTAQLAESGPSGQREKAR